MSNTPGSPYGEFPPTSEGKVALDVKDPHDHHWFKEPTEEVGPRFVGGLVFAQLVFFIALLGPAIVGIGLKVQSVVPLAQQTSAVGVIAGFGALFAVIGNVLFGRLSDRTTSRFGRRRPWIIGGTVVMTIAFVVMALGQTVPVITAGWCLAQLGANATLAPFIATISNQVPKVPARQRIRLAGHRAERRHPGRHLPRATVQGPVGGAVRGALDLRDWSDATVRHHFARPAPHDPTAQDDRRGMYQHLMGQPCQASRLCAGLVVAVPDHAGHLYVHDLPAVLPQG